MKNTTAMADYELRHIEALRKDLAGCTVLLKKDGSFPLEKPCTLAAYGSGVRRTIRGGTGSGEVNSRYIVTIEEGLQQAGFTLTGMEWHTGYEQAREKAHKAFLKQLKKDAKAAKQNFILYGMGKHAVGNASMPDSIMEMLSGPMKLVMSLMGGNGKPKAGCEIKTQYCTAIPIGTALAQSFDTDFVQRCGDIVGEEMEHFGVHLWLAPALNIHRSIRCGRNFEYYSEDPLVSGKMAAAMTRGVQAHKGCGTTIKHYAANNKEYNRTRNNSMVSERAMREIYLKGFGICVRESQPKAVMTSYNLLNGTHTADSRGLVTDILRAEFGYQGIVMTDWVTPMTGDARSAHRDSQAQYVAAAGGDLFMPGNKGDYDNLLQGIDSGAVTLEQVKINASRVVRTVRALTQE